ncbi:MAG: hypothetical protein IJ092_00780 [Atopobiaceae bacterium]|nr:hypothetical protein [Atopobiaceae bacterium]
MEFTLCGLSALSVLRELRKRRTLDISHARRVNLSAPLLAEKGKKPRKAIAQFLEGYSCIEGFSPKHPLHIAVPSPKDRPRVKDVVCTVYSGGLPDGAFIDIGNGLAMSSPELLFIELANVMSSEVHLLLGMELCGTYARDSVDPRNGEVAYQVPAVTSVSKLRAFVESCWHVNGMGRAKATLEWLQDGAWSPMEAILAMLAVLPGAMLGYDLWPVDLNKRVDVGENAEKGERVPDLVFRGTEVGLNYDGEDHLPLQEIVDAAMRVVASPGDESLQKELEQALRDARDGAVSDKRRDRDLGAAGLTVFAMTKEDLYERGGLDRLMMQVIDAIERSGKRRLNKQRIMLESKLLSEMRQELIWSLLPGKVGHEHAPVYAELMKPNPDPARYQRKARLVDGSWKISQEERSEIPTYEVYF